MRTSDEIRLQNLENLVRTHGGVTNLTRALSRSTRDNTLNQLLNKSPSSTTGVQKHMGTKLAREIEEALGLERGYMDNEHNRNNESSPYAIPDFPGYELLSIKQKEVVRMTLLQLIEAMVGGTPNQNHEKQRGAA